MTKLFVTDLDVRGQRVLVRADLNVPLEKGEITDDRRIRASLETVRWLIEHGARVILMSHLGRPKGERKPEFSLAPVAERLGEILRKEVPLAEDCVGPPVQAKLQAIGDGDVLLLENLRFHGEETKNDPAFAAELASLADLYVNDAFGTSHRAHASMEGVPRQLGKGAMGFLLKRELDYLGKSITDPARPFTAIIGGAKVSSKIGVIRTLLERVDSLIIGGGMAYTLLKAQGHEIGKSLCEDDYLGEARKILAAAGSGEASKLLLPVDIVAASDYANDADTQVVPATSIPADREGLDIGPASRELFAAKIRESKTVIWNGPMGVFEMSNFAHGTKAIAEALVAATDSGATTIVGGGDSAAAIKAAGLDDRVSHVSTGGGASLEMLEGKPFPAVEALTDA